MENNKYYTPTIEEFHVGFEYEYQEFGKIKWKKDVFKLGQCPYGEEQRVKNLDREDIESFGLELKSIEDFKHLAKERGVKQIKYLNFQIQDPIPNRFLYFKLALELDKTKNNVSISGIFHDKPSIGKTILFQGTIKNKSELKRVLTQIGVL